MKKIFILTGEASGDKLASKAISELKTINPNVEYLSVGGENLKKIGIKTIYDLRLPVVILYMENIKSNRDMGFITLVAEEFKCHSISNVVDI